MENLIVTPCDSEVFLAKLEEKKKKKKSVTVKCDSRRDWRIRWKPIPGSQTKCTKLNAIIIIIIIIITFPRSDLEFSTILYFGVRFILGLWKLAETCVCLRASQEASEFWTLGLEIGILGGFRFLGFGLVLVCGSGLEGRRGSLSAAESLPNLQLRREIFHLFLETGNNGQWTG